VDDDTLYIFPKKLISDSGIFLNFKQQGFELQKFLNVNLIESYKVHNDDYKEKKLD
jgi:hypothetical protein